MSRASDAATLLHSTAVDRCQVDPRRNYVVMRYFGRDIWDSISLELHLVRALHTGVCTFGWRNVVSFSISYSFRLQLHDRAWARSAPRPPRNNQETTVASPDTRPHAMTCVRQSRCELCDTHMPHIEV